jgi:hypothetical protein
MFNTLYLTKSIFSNFEPMAFIENLKYMLSGMIAIFIVIGVIILATIVLNKIFTSKK